MFANVMTHALAGLGAVVAVAVAALVLAGPAAADHKVCFPVGETGQVICRVVQDPSPKAGPPGVDGGSGGCATNGVTIPCSIPGDGTWNAAYSCYATPMNPQPALGDPLWAGHSTGTVYQCTGGQGAGFFWSAQPPPGPPSAAVLAQRAQSMLTLTRMTATSNGGPSGTTYVGLSTWLWLPSDQWHAITSPPATVGARSVTATATPVSVSWAMGDGGSAMCAGPGAPFNSADPFDPVCGYTYRVDSLAQPQTGSTPNDRYFTVQATVRWQVSWVCTGNCDQNGGRLPDMTWATTTMPLRVFQVETVVTGGY